MPRQLLRDGDPRIALRTRGLRVTLDGRTILAGADADFVTRGINALIGPNGAGKTTLIKAVLGLLPYEGFVELRARPDGRAPRLAYVPQRLDFDRGMPITVRDLLCADRQRRPLFLGHSPRATAHATRVLRLVGAERLLGQPLGRLSGGEFQRVLIALAMLGEPDVLLLDEPVSGIDVSGEALFCDLLVKLREQAGITIVLVSHEMSIVVQHTDHVVCLSDRVVQCQGDAVTTLTPANIARVFGAHSGLYEHGHVHAHPGQSCTEAHPGHHHPHMPADVSHRPSQDPGP
jgi:zinc transport system ATP-binding protein